VGINISAKSAGYSEKIPYKTCADNIRKPQIQKAREKLVDEEGRTLNES